MVRKIDIANDQIEKNNKKILYDSTISVHHHYTENATEGSRIMKVILIGNSSIDKTKEVGFQIDNDFDLIVRMNRYQTEGFENYIGSKTHIWSLNSVNICWSIKGTLQCQIVI